MGSVVDTRRRSDAMAWRATTATTKSMAVETATAVHGADFAVNFGTLVRFANDRVCIRLIFLRRLTTNKKTGAQNCHDKEKRMQHFAYVSLRGRQGKRVHALQV